MKIPTSEPHQVDLWHVTSKQTMTSADLQAMIAIIVQTLLPNVPWRTEPRIHPYTQEGLQVDVQVGSEWIEIGECDLAHPAIVRENIPHANNLTGLACGLGLDRIIMLRKGMHDIRLLRSTDSRIVAQMHDLSPYKEVSSMPPVTRDLSLVLDASKTLEDLGDRVRESLGSHAAIVGHHDAWQ